MTDNWAELRRLADGATPGPWRVGGPHAPDWIGTVEPGRYGSSEFVASTVTSSDPRGLADAAYIAAADPDRIRRLLDRLDELEAKCK